MKVYISGKISGLPIEAVKLKFQEAENLLESVGFEVVNPIKNDLSLEASWNDHLVKDVELLLQCDGIFMLSDWMQSVGSGIEYDVATRTKKHILFESNIVTHQKQLIEIQSIIHEVTGMKLNEYRAKGRQIYGFYARMLFAHTCKEKGIRQEIIINCLCRDRTTVRRYLLLYYHEVRNSITFRELAQKVNQKINKL